MPADPVRPPEPHVSEHDGVNRLVFGSPILSTSHLGALAGLLDELASAPRPRPLVLWSCHPRIFLAGAHLAEIAGLDEQTSRDYARFGRAVIDRLARFPSPTVAAVNGPCTGGGLDLVLALDAVIAGPAARFAHPGVRRGLVTGWGGTTRLPAAIGVASARRFMVEAGDLTPAAARRAGIALTSSAVLDQATREARRLGGIHRRRLELWRSLKRGRFVDRFRVFVVHNLLRETGSLREDWRA